MKFDLVAHCTISVTTQVEAETLRDAIRIAQQRTDILNGQFEDPEITQHWVAHEYDGTPYNIREDE